MGMTILMFEIFFYNLIVWYLDRHTVIRRVTKWETLIRITLVAVPIVNLILLAWGMFK